MALPVFKTGLSMQVDRWVRLPPSPAIFVLLGFGLQVGVQVDSAVSNRAYGCHFSCILGRPFYARGFRVGVQVDSAVSNRAYGCRFVRILGMPSYALGCG